MELRLFYLALCMILLLLTRLGSAQPAAVQSADYIFAGQSLGVLTTAVGTNHVNLETADFHDDLIKREFECVFVPASQASATAPHLYTARRARPKLNEVVVSKNDYKALVAFADDSSKIMEYVVVLKTGDSATIKTARKSIDDLIEKLGPAAKPAAMQFIGALELANGRNIASPYTLAYKAHVLDQVSATVNSIGNPRPGEPIAGGLGQATYDMLLQLNFKDVQPAIYNGKHFQQVWVGADFVLLPQERQTSWPISAKTGFDALNLRPELKNEILFQEFGGEKPVSRLQAK
jgi:hypothetical protein